MLKSGFPAADTSSMEEPDTITWSTQDHPATNIAYRVLTAPFWIVWRLLWLVWAACWAIFYLPFYCLLRLMGHPATRD